MGKPFAVVVLLLLTLLLSQQAESAGTGEVGRTNRSHRVVIHLNSSDERVQHEVLNNIRTLYQDVGREKLQLELVAHGEGLSLLTTATTSFKEELTRLKAEFGLHYTACSNSMKAAKLTREDLIPEVEDTVPAMVRLMERQEQGWAYIKP